MTSETGPVMPFNRAVHFLTRFQFLLIVGKPSLSGGIWPLGLLAHSNAISGI
jgi:hypothetical protein